MRILDLFSGAGGAAMGYHRAGFEVVGVDHAPQPRYPFEHHQADALEFLADHGHEFDAIHASPPCQAYSRATLAARRRGVGYPDLLAATRRLLNRVGRPWVIENVPGAPMCPSLVLCGCMWPDELVGLQRRRWFELSWPTAVLRPPCHHPDPAVTPSNTGSGGPHQPAYRHLRGAEWAAVKARAMGVDWMSRAELSQAIPPAYTQHVGELLAAHLTQTPGRSATVRLHPHTTAAPGRATA